ncbi:hypothetical protein GMSM_15940 [Geomonas sp. Red276]
MEMAASSSFGRLSGGRESWAAKAGAVKSTKNRMTTILAVMETPGGSNDLPWTSNGYASSGNYRKMAELRERSKRKEEYPTGRCGIFYKRGKPMQARQTTFSG